MYYCSKSCILSFVLGRRTIPTLLHCLIDRMPVPGVVAKRAWLFEVTIILLSRCVLATGATGVVATVRVAKFSRLQPNLLTEESKMTEDIMECRVTPITGRLVRPEHDPIVYCAGKMRGVEDFN